MTTIMTTATGNATTTPLVTTMAEAEEAAQTLSIPGLLRLLQLASPALPVGAFAYSQGLEPAVAAGWVHDEPTAGDWMAGLLEHSLGGLEVPLLLRLHRAWVKGDREDVARWNDLGRAARATRELQAEDRRLGAALARVLEVNMFALACQDWGIPPTPAACALLFAWAESQVAAAVRLVSLGQSAGQRILSRLGQAIPAVVQTGLALPDDDIGQGALGLALASAWHETQYTRIFRS
jgi:urease accessory protein